MVEESEQFQEEIAAIDAIYPDYLTKLAPLIYRFKIPLHEHVTVQMSFPEDYPNEKPHILDVVSERDEYNDDYLVDLFQEVLDSIFNKGDVCIFDLFTELDAVLYNGEDDVENGNEDDHWIAEDNIHKDAPREKDEVETLTSAMKSSNLGENDIEKLQHEDDEEEEEEEQEIQDYTNYVYDEAKEKSRAKNKANKNNSSNKTETIDPLKGWIISDPISDRKSTFVTFTRRVTSVDEAYYYLDLLKTDKKVSRASHNMTAWRIKDKDTGAQYQDCDDDGETAAGGRLLHLLSIMDVWDVMVVCSRWFGGVHIGPDRFKHINATARDAVVKAGFITDSSKTKKKK